MNDFEIATKFAESNGFKTKISRVGKLNDNTMVYVLSGQEAETSEKDTPPSTGLPVLILVENGNARFVPDKDIYKVMGAFNY